MFKPWYYFFALLTIEWGTPLAVLLFTCLYTRCSRNPRPIWITLPAFFIFHIVGLGIYVVSGLDGDWLKYQSATSWPWAVAYYGPAFLSLAALGYVLWSGMRPRQVPPPGFEVMFK